MPTVRVLWCLILGSVVACLASLAGSTARAEGDGQPDEPFIAVCIQRLADGDHRSRTAARAGLTQLGARVVPALLKVLREESREADFERIATVWRGMPANVARQALDAQRGAWAAKWKSRLEDEVARLRAKTPPAKGEIPASKAKWLRATIGDLVDPLKTKRSFGTPNPTVDSMVALGPSAVPFLLESLRENGGGDRFFAGRAVAEALSRMITPSEVPAIQALLVDDCLVAAFALGRLRSEEVAETLLDCVRSQRLDGGMLQLVSEYLHRQDFQVALVGWLKENGIQDDFDRVAGSVAGLLGDRRVFEALPILQELAAKPTHGRIHWQFIQTLVRLGDASRIEKLVYYFRYPPGRREQHAMGQCLNWVVGKIVYRGEIRGFDLKSNAEDAEKEFQAWWDANKSQLKYDRVLGYSVSK